MTEREKKPWRAWGKSAYIGGKPKYENVELNLVQLQERIDAHLDMLAYIEPIHFQLTARDIPPYNHIGSEMIQFCTDVFGNEGWLQLF